MHLPFKTLPSSIKPAVTRTGAWRRPLRWLAGRLATTPSGAPRAPGAYALLAENRQDRF